VVSLYCAVASPDAPRPYRAFAYPWLPILYILATAAICIDLLIFQPRNTVGGLIIVAIGLPLYFIARRNSRGAE
jgi:basic amino acid/polyamine antiporter, APA family